MSSSVARIRTTSAPVKHPIPSYCSRKPTAPANDLGPETEETGCAVLKAKLMVQACLRASAANGLGATLLRRGYEDAGAILIRLDLLDGTAVVLTQTRTPNGEQAWMRGSGVNPVPAAEADAYIDRQVGRDPDIWVVEVEDRAARHPLGERIL